MKSNRSPSPTFAPADEDAALALCRQIFHEEGRSDEFLDPTIAAGFDHPRDLFLLAKLHDVIICCGALKELSRSCPGCSLIPSHRGSGLASGLFDALFERTRGLGYTTIVLDVNQESAHAIRFYEKQGMEVFTPAPHLRWLESAPEEHQYARYFRKRVGKAGQ